MLTWHVANDSTVFANRNSKAIFSVARFSLHSAELLVSIRIAMNNALLEENGHCLARTCMNVGLNHGHGLMRRKYILSNERILSHHLG